ncbi:MAG: hypothetical protein ABJA98_24570 [Acidobacteriota bacterium]
MKATSFTNSVLIAGGTLALYALWQHVHQPGGPGLQQLASPAAWDEAPLVFAGLAAIFFASLGLRASLRRGVAICSVSVLVVLYAAELVLASTALGPEANLPFWSIDRAPSQKKQEMVKLAAKFGTTIDTRERREIFADSSKRGIDMVPAVMLADVLDTNGPLGFKESTNTNELMPLGGIANTQTLLCNESGQFVSYLSDEHGFRNPQGIWNVPRIDIAAVGQSFTQGYCVQDGQGFVDLLRTANRRVLNLGISGQSSLLELAAIREYLPRYAPKAVLWFFTEGIDLADLLTESTHPFLMRYLDPTFSQDLLARQPEVDQALRRVVSKIDARDRARSPAKAPSLVNRSMEIAKLWTLRHKVELMYGSNTEEPQVWSMLEQTSHNLLSTALDQAKTVTNSWGGTLYFVYLPSWNRYRNSPRPADREHQEVLNLVKALGIPVIDIQPAFQAQDDPLSLFPFRKFGHYDERGNRLVASTLMRFLSAPVSMETAAAARPSPNR